jgi:signal transduction histidine kinase
VALAGQMRAEREVLTRRWLDRIAARVDLEPIRIFPTDTLLDHIPILIDGIADYLADPSSEISAEMPVIGKALELGQLRFDQGFAAHQILKEYELLGGVLFAFVARNAERLDAPCKPEELLACAHRLFRAISVIQQVTTTQFLRSVDERVNEREERLRSFNRTVSHELKNRISAVVGAGQLLDDDAIVTDTERRVRFTRMVIENAEAMQSLLQDLIALSRMDSNARQQRHVLLPKAVAEVMRQLREMARSRGVDLQIDPKLPTVEVNAAAVELCLTNYISNAIKYSDPDKPRRWVKVRGQLRRDQSVDRELVVEVRDNGIGVPPDARDRLFQRFFRAHGTQADVEGTGLGLSIVRETIESIGGRAWAEFEGADGSRFFLALPSRRGGLARGDGGDEPRLAPTEVTG